MVVVWSYLARHSYMYKNRRLLSQMSGWLFKDGASGVEEGRKEGRKKGGEGRFFLEGMRGGPSFLPLPPSGLPSSLYVAPPPSA